MAGIQKKNQSEVLSVKFWIFGHFLGNSLLKVSNFTHDSRRLQGGSLECGAFMGKP